MRIHIRDPAVPKTATSRWIADSVLLDCNP